MTLDDYAKREEIALLNSNAMAKIMLDTGVLIRPADYAKWRPTERTSGDIPGIPCTVVCIATDGNLGIFETSTDEGHGLGRHFVGHVHRFSGGTPPPLYSMPPPEKPARPKGEQAPRKPADAARAAKRALLKSILESL